MDFKLVVLLISIIISFKRRSVVCKALGLSLFLSLCRYFDIVVNTNVINYYRVIENYLPIILTNLFCVIAIFTVITRRKKILLITMRFRYFGVRIINYFVAKNERTVVCRYRLHHRILC